MKKAGAEKKEPNRISKTILTAIRNGPGYRPLQHNITGGDVVIASYNVHKCIGIDKQFNPQRTAEVIKLKSADVIAPAGEADGRFGERSGLLDLGLLERRHGGLDAVPITATMPKGHSWHGNVLLFREGVNAMCSSSSCPVIETARPLRSRTATNSRAGPLRVIAAHLGLDAPSSRPKASACVLQGRHAADPAIGDLNDGASASVPRSRSPHADGPTMSLNPAFRASHRGSRFCAGSRAPAHPQSGHIGGSAQHAAGAAGIRSPAGQGTSLDLKST